MEKNKKEKEKGRGGRWQEEEWGGNEVGPQSLTGE
jgi:hypothetical protein